MPTQLEIYNTALLHLGAQQLATLTDAIESRRVLDAFYENGKEFMLEQGFWKFALRSVEITRDLTISPTFGYSYPHNKPDDWVKTFAVSSSEYIEQYPLEDWIEESNLWLADVTPLFVRYVSDDADFGGDLDRWTSRFTSAFEYYLAFKAAKKITGSETLRDEMKKQFDIELSKALAQEAMREPPRRPPEGSWNAARSGRAYPRRTAGGWQF